MDGENFMENPMNKWMIYFMENPIKMDDLGLNTPIFGGTPMFSKVCEFLDLQLDFLHTPASLKTTTPDSAKEAEVHAKETGANN